MSDEELAKIFYLETRQRSDTPDIEARIIWAHSAGLCAGREQERERAREHRNDGRPGVAEDRERRENDRQRANAPRSIDRRTGTPSGKNAS